MIFAPSSDLIDDYLASTDVLNFRSREVQDLANKLDGAEAAFTFVRDEIAHSRDVGRWSAAYKSADVLAARNAICHGKAHLLVALLRAQGVPAGLCYQKLSDDIPSGFVLHALVGIYCKGKWSRLDARGNKPGIDAQFDLDRERIAFTTNPQRGEVDYTLVYPEPPLAVLDALQSANSGTTNYQYLPSHLES